MKRLRVIVCRNMMKGKRWIISSTFKCCSRCCCCYCCCCSSCSCSCCCSWCCSCCCCCYCCCCNSCSCCCCCCCCRCSCCCSCCCCCCCCYSNCRYCSMRTILGRLRATYILAEWKLKQLSRNTCCYDGFETLKIGQMLIKTLVDNFKGENVQGVVLLTLSLITVKLCIGR